MTLMLKRVERPRELKWYQAGAMLYGDWGTSKAYVLGIAFALAGHASWFFLGLMAILTSLVGICYMIVCRVYPDGGGVYSAVRARSKILAVIGALLLVADYVVTASLSAFEAFHYFNVPSPEVWAIISIFVIGALNWVGPSQGSRLAAFIALAASISAAVLFLFTLPSLPHVDLKMPDAHAFGNWSIFVGIVLALSGVESVANMTGIMVPPVQRTASKAIWPVMLEVTILTFLLGIAMNAIPGLQGHAEDMLRALGTYYIGPWYGSLISFVFGFLLLSAVNTSISSLTSIQFLMAKDNELPFAFSKLNRFGMPYLALIVATVVPAIVLIFEHDIVGLSSLYAIGVVGAITMNLGSCATNFNLRLKFHERLLLLGSSSILFVIEMTIAYQKHNALIFAAAILGTGLSLRQMTKVFMPVRIPAEVPTANVLTVSEAKEIAPLYSGSTLVAIRYMNEDLIEEAALRTKAMNENTLYVTYIEEAPSTTTDVPSEIAPSAESLELFAQVEKELEKRGITSVPIWQLGDNPGKMIARSASELGVDTVIIGTTKRSALVSLLRGDVLKTLAHNLPKNCRLLIAG
jgi:amino acid transporter